MQRKFDPVSEFLIKSGIDGSARCLNGEDALYWMIKSEDPGPGAWPQVVHIRFVRIMAHILSLIPLPQEIVEALVKMGADLERALRLQASNWDNLPAWVQPLRVPAAPAAAPAATVAPVAPAAPVARSADGEGDAGSDGDGGGSDAGGGDGDGGGEGDKGGGVVARAGAHSRPHSRERSRSRERSPSRSPSLPTAPRVAKSLSPPSAESGSAAAPARRNPPGVHELVGAHFHDEGVEWQVEAVEFSTEHDCDVAYYYDVKKYPRGVDGDLDDCEVRVRASERASERARCLSLSSRPSQRRTFLTQLQRDASSRHAGVYDATATNSPVVLHPASKSLRGVALELAHTALSLSLSLSLSPRPTAALSLMAARPPPRDRAFHGSLMGKDGILCACVRVPCARSRRSPRSSRGWGRRRVRECAMRGRARSLAATTSSAGRTNAPPTRRRQHPARPSRRP